ncbi:MAG TPA: co-chaperone GroES [Candidatus Bathyarchaeia archaeon]|nr:co-chaperone GroES [Candidatus Bathyarchaeia archaeon]
MSKTNIQPLGENVLIEPMKHDTKTASGIVLPDSSGEKPQEGKVVAVGDDKKIKVKAEQKVIYSKYSGNEVRMGENDYLLVKNEDILAIVK